MTHEIESSIEKGTQQHMTLDRNRRGVVFVSSTPTCWLLYAAVRRAWARTVGLGACGCGRKITAMVHGYSCTSSIGAITGSAGTGCGRGTAKRCDLRFISFGRMSESS